MKPLIHPKLINDPFGDAGLYVDFLWDRRAFLFDLGTNLHLTPKSLLKVTDVFISHTHIDHFIGFDHLLRLLLGREKRLRIFGPTGIISNVEGKLSSYTWDIIEEYPLSIEVFEVGECIDSAFFMAKAGFKKEKGGKEPFNGTLLKDPLFTIKAVPLDHHTTSLAFSIKERFHINIDKEGVNRLNLPAGDWLRKLKQAIWEEKEKDSVFTIRWEKDGNIEEREFQLGFLMDEMVIITEGQKITYVADAIFNSENERRIIEIASGADIFFCEATYLHRDRDKARERHHLTAREAGLLARKAGVKRLEVFHFSPRYQHNPEELFEEADQAYKV